MENIERNLIEIIDEIRHEMALLERDLAKTPRFVAASRRARVSTVNLTKIFKEFRKLSRQYDVQCL